MHFHHRKFQWKKQKLSSVTETEAAPSTNDETPPSVEDKNETSQVQDAAEKPEPEETNTAADKTQTPVVEEASEAVEEEEAEKPEIKSLSLSSYRLGIF
uniref:Uncharacterized protein n=1 Tax=Zea mays TaxID=4577 RepID=A0A804RHG5_MAIZE